MTNPPLQGLVRLREKHGFRQHHLARVIGITQSQLNKIEHGKVRLDVHRAQTLAKFLGCHIEDLF